MAGESVYNFSAAVDSRKSDTVHIRIEENSEIFTIPRRALKFLSQILSSMAEGKTISLIPSESELSTQQAADMLNVSRPYVVKLLETGVIPFKKVGTHRRIPLEALLAYETEQKQVRNTNLEFLAKQAQDLNMGYE
ncbi:excisionase [Dyadobacter luteus]|uniref:Excisionase n=2 Tax=Dyadobacter luteus TaxID=2259619 RepID=A0A3D8YC19_9BACT|nr:excisionase [Dyadobacter luteus]